MSEIAANVDQDPRPASNLEILIKLTIRSFVLSAIAMVLVSFRDPVSTQSTLEQLRNFTPATMAGLIGDAAMGCVPDDAPDSQPKTPKAADEKQCAKSVMNKDTGVECGELLHGGPPTIRRCTKPLVDGWPATGHWVPRAEANGFPRLPFVSAAIVAADVTRHLVLLPEPLRHSQPGVVVGFLVLLQLVFGFGITAAIAKAIARWLNDGVLVLFLVFGTLMVGAAFACWVVLPVVGVILTGLVSLNANPLISSVFAIATTYASGIALIKALLKRYFDPISGQAADSLADKTARWFVRYVP
jgi:hypothetical protein